MHKQLRCMSRPSAAGFTDNSNINVLPLPDGKTALSMTEAAQGTYLVSGGVGVHSCMHGCAACQMFLVVHGSNARCAHRCASRILRRWIGSSSRTMSRVC